MVGVGFLATVLVSLYLSFSSGFRFVQLTRENLRATQILTEKLETIRLYTWDQINTAGFVPTNFSTAFYPVSNGNGNANTNGNGGATNGLIYSGTMKLSAAPVTESYSGDMRLVEVEISWASGGRERRRSMTTLVSQYGIQNYKPN